MSKLAGKVALVTGASRGIGAAIAKRLAGGWRERRHHLCEGFEGGLRSGGSD